MKSDSQQFNDLMKAMLEIDKYGTYLNPSPFNSRGPYSEGVTSDT
jgi:hypothetical protein